MAQLFIFIIFIVSVGGIAFILSRKVPVLLQLPQNGHHGIKKPEVVLKAQQKIKNLHFKFIQKQVLLHKILSVVKVLVLKTETKLDTLLHGIRKNAQKLDQEKGKK